MGQHDYEFDGFALQPGSAVFESLDAAGFDCHVPETHLPMEEEGDGCGF